MTNETDQKEQKEQLELQVEIKDVGEHKKEIGISVSAKDVTKRLKNAYEDVRKHAQVPGFRPGKVPETVLRARFGKLVMKEVAGTLLSDSLTQALEVQDLEVIGQPVLEEGELKAEQPYAYKITVETVPPVTLGDYKDLSVPLPDLEVTEADIDKEINYFREMRAVKQSIVDRPAALGDYVLLEAASKIEDSGEELLPPTELEIETLPAGIHFSGSDFENRLVGMNLNETNEFVLDFPEDYEMANYAGKKVRFTVSIKEIKAKVLPEINDEFASDYGDYNSVAEMRSDVQRRLSLRYASTRNEMIEEMIIMAAVKNAQFEPPEKMIEQQIGNLIGTDDAVRVEASREQYALAAQQMVKQRYVLRAIAKQEQIKVSDDELDDEIEKIAGSAGKDFESYRAEMEEHDLLDRLRSSMVEHKARAFVLEHANTPGYDRPAAKAGVIEAVALEEPAAAALAEDPAIEPVPAPSDIPEAPAADDAASQPE